MSAERKFNKFDSVSLSCKRGDKETFLFTAYQADDTILNLSGETLTCHIRSTPSATSKLFEVAITNTSPSNYTLGKFAVILSKTVTRALPDICYFDVAGELLDGTLVSGTITATDDVTR